MKNLKEAVHESMLLSSDSDDDAKIGNPHPDIIVGECIYTMAIPYSWIGRVVKVTEEFLYLSEAGWNKDTPATWDMLTRGEVSQYMPVPNIVRLPWALIGPIMPWVRPLPQTPKR